MHRYNFDIQKVHVDGVSIFYQVYYKQTNNVYKLMTDKQFPSRAMANAFIDSLMGSNDNE